MLSKAKRWFYFAMTVVGKNFPWRDRQTDKQTKMYTHKHTGTHSHTNTHTHKHAHTQTRTHTHTHTQTINQLSTMLEKDEFGVSFLRINWEYTWKLYFTANYRLNANA